MCSERFIEITLSAHINVPKYPIDRINKPYNSHLSIPLHCHVFACLLVCSFVCTIRSLRCLTFVLLSVPFVPSLILRLFVCLSHSFPPLFCICLLVCTFRIDSSNFCRIIDELRSTVASKANKHIIDVICLNSVCVDEHSEVGW